MKYGRVFQMGIQVKRNGNNSFQGKRHLRTDRSLQDKRTFLQTYTKQAGSTEAVKKLGHGSMGRWDQAGRQYDTQEWVDSQQEEVHSNLWLCEDLLWLERSWEKAGTKQMWVQQLSTPAWSLHDREYVLFKVQCQMYRKNKQTAPPFIPSNPAFLILEWRVGGHGSLVATALS